MAEVAVRRCCDKFTDEKAAPAVFYAKLDDNSPTEFACCGEKACDDKQTRQPPAAVARLVVERGSIQDGFSG